MKVNKKRNLRANTLERYKMIVDEWFINGFCGASAYQKFYKNVKRESTATVNFNVISKLPEVKQYILQKQEEAAKIIEVTKEGILKELKNWIESDITETIGLKPEEIKELPIELRRLINKYKHTSNDYYDQKGNLLKTTEVIELSFVSKERALEMINKHIGFYEEDNKQKKVNINYEGLNDNTLMDLIKNQIDE